jgi:DNA replication ATP-dependent helicase Dna2
MAKQSIKITEPAHSLMYAPGSLTAGKTFTETDSLYQKVKPYLKDEFNDKQEALFHDTFRNRLSLLWGPPGTGKTTVLAGTILGWIEHHAGAGIHLRIGIGSSNYNAIDNVLNEILDLINRRTSSLGAFTCPIRVARVRSDSSAPPLNDQIEDMPRTSTKAQGFVNALKGDDAGIIVAGGTWQQLGRLAEKDHQDSEPSAQWFDLLVIDEASQVPVAAAAAYFLLLKSDGHVVLAGDHRQLGPIYGFQMKDSVQGLFDCIFSYMSETHNITPIQLKHNYRTNVEISAWPRKRFYSNEYEAFFPERKLDLAIDIDTKPADWPEQLPWSDQFLRILDPACPVVVISYSANTYTLSNPLEAQIVSALTLLYKKLVDSQQSGVTPQEFWTQKIGIVTPHRAQMASIRNLLVNAAGMTMDPPPFVDTVDRFQGQERDLILSSYVVADKDFVSSEDSFILSSRRFNVTLTRARSKFVMLISNALLQYLPSDPDVARDAAHLQLFVEQYCGSICDTIELPFFERGALSTMKCKLRGRFENCV